MNYTYNSYDQTDENDEERLDEGYTDEDPDPLEEIRDLTLPPEDLELLEDEDETDNSSRNHKRASS